MRGDHAEHRQEPVGCAGGAEAFHGAFALPGRLVRVLRPVVQVPRLPVLDRRHHRPMRHLIASELVGDQHPRYPALLGQQRTEEPLGALGIPARSDQDVEDIAVLVDGPPQVVTTAVDRQEHLVEVPLDPLRRQPVAAHADRAHRGRLLGSPPLRVRGPAVDADRHVHPRPAPRSIPQRLKIGSTGGHPARGMASRQHRPTVTVPTMPSPRRSPRQGGRPTPPSSSSSRMTVSSPFSVPGNITAASASYTCDLRITAGQPGERGQAVGKIDDLHFLHWSRQCGLPATGSGRHRHRSADPADRHRPGSSSRVAARCTGRRAAPIRGTRRRMTPPDRPFPGDIEHARRGCRL